MKKTEYKFERIVNGKVRKYVDALGIPVDGKLYYVAFKVPGFMAPYAQNGLVDVVALCEKDRDRLAKWGKANVSKRPEIAEAYHSAPILVPMLEAGFEPGRETRLFDLLSEEEFANLTLPGKQLLQAEIAVKDDELTQKQNQIEELEAQLAKLKNDGGGAAG